jgi:hypothetical protein
MLAAVLALRALSSVALEPGQTCRQTRNWLERTLCGDATLRQRDAALAKDFQRLLESAPNIARPSLAADQKQWRSALRFCRRRSQPLACLHGRFEGRATALRQHPDYPDDGDASALPLAGEGSDSAAGRGWTRSLRAYLKALQACREESQEPITRVLLGWHLPGEEAVGLALVDRGLRQWVCIAHSAGYKVLRFEPGETPLAVTEAGPVYHPGGSTAPVLCVNAIQFAGANGRPAGWISERDC